MQRYDTVAIAATRTGEGFIRDSPVVGRAGLLRYVNADGSTRIEYRPPDEAFRADSLKSLEGKPITLGHKAMVTARNAADVRPVGTVLTGGRQDGDAIRADVVIYNLDTDARELSCGYNLDLDETPGTTPDGQHYDAIQRNIVYNHLAIVPKGRAGVARLNMDGEQELDGKDESMSEKTTKIRLDGGLEYDAAPEVGVYIEKLRQDIAALTKERDTVQAKCDAASADLEKAKKAHEDAEKAHKEAFDSAVKERVALLDVAKAHNVEKADGLTNEEIKIAVIKAVRGDAIDLTDKSADYIAAAFDLCRAEKAARADNMAQQRKDTLSKPDANEDAKDDPDAAYARLKEAESKMYMKGRGEK